MTPRSVHKILGLHVETQSGVALGKVHTILVDVSTHTITHYEVQKGIIPGRHSTFLIHTSSVLEITDEKMVVVDDVSRQESRASAQSKGNLSTMPESVLSSVHK